MNCIALSLPTVLVLGLAVYFYLDKVPEIEKAERDRVKAVYRETAAGIQKGAGRLAALPAEAQPKEWKPAGKMSPGRWGFVPDPAQRTALVWYEEGTNYYTGSAALEPETNYRLHFIAFGVFSLLVLVGVTVFGIRYFISYVKSRDDFLAATAHDLTTPLVGMRMMIGRNDGEAKVLNERMILIVNNIKDFMRLGGRRRPPSPKPVDVAALCREAYRLFVADYEDSDGGGVEFGRGFGDGGAVKALADETMTLQILWNLFGNDLKYAAPYGKVSVRVAEEGGFVKVEFVDEGQGMTGRQMKRAFDRYYRAQTVLESGKGGFGIGLCTAREFARAMGGDLTVRANRPNGCVFTLVLPGLREQGAI